jgi:hypothetical protein
MVREISAGWSTLRLDAYQPTRKDNGWTHTYPHSSKVTLSTQRKLISVSDFFVILCTYINEIKECHLAL